jgi:phospholipase C
MKRRGVLKGLAAVAAAPALGAANGDQALAVGRGAAAGARAAALRGPGSLPYPRLAPGSDTIPQIEHIVVLMMENHSYDNKLGMLARPGADGFTLGANGKPTASNPYPGGKKIQHAFRMPTTCQVHGNPSQTWDASHTAYDGGKNDGFVAASGAAAMGYWQKADQPFYYSLASVFPIADRYFSSVLGQTFPNRRYLMAATSLGMVNDDQVWKLAPIPSEYPKNGTVFDQLNAHGISWRDYWSSTPTALLWPYLLVKDPLNAKRIVPIDHFFKDAANGSLPGFCIVEPDFGNTSEENPQNVASGEAFAAKVINAVMSGPKWSSTLLIWTYDEHGGYYDHVPPPKAVPPDSVGPDGFLGGPAFDGFGRYGFRVPCAVVSPWARPGYVSHKVFDHTSILKLVETKWNLPALTRRDANALNMLDMLDLSHAAFAKPPALAKPLVATDSSALACNVNGPGTIPPPGSVTGAGLVAGAGPVTGAGSVARA